MVSELLLGTCHADTVDHPGADLGLPTPPELRLIPHGPNAHPDGVSLDCLVAQDHQVNEDVAMGQDLPRAWRLYPRI